MPVMATNLFAWSVGVAESSTSMEGAHRASGRMQPVRPEVLSIGQNDVGHERVGAGDAEQRARRMCGFSAKSVVLRTPEHVAVLGGVRLSLMHRYWRVIRLAQESRIADVVGVDVSEDNQPELARKGAGLLSCGDDPGPRGERVPFAGALAPATDSLGGKPCHSARHAHNVELSMTDA